MGDIGSGSGTDYPGALDTQSTPEVDWPNPGATDARADVGNDLADAILAVQGEIGVTGSQNFLRSDATAILTPEGGVAIRMANKTGSLSVKGTIVEADTGIDNAFKVADASSDHAIGIVYEDGIVDGGPCYVVVSGIAQVLLEDTSLSTRGNWVQTSTTAGRADATMNNPNPPTHWREVGHCIESKVAGADVLAKVVLHFN